ncbi:hypothetical protein HWV62_43276 [Athelia sp. TMB]|nr:hypothetical protein HWV62_43276 [Athelia sp. TMB]
MPFSSLPEDVLLPIFTMVLSEHKNNPYTYTDDPPIAMQLSQISPLARHVVRNASLLWTAIDNAVLQNASRLHTHLELSGQRPLDISTDLGEGGTIFSNLAPLLGHVHRWRRLHLWSIGDDEIEQILTALRGLCAPILEDLHIMLDNEANLPPRTISIFQAGTPSLKDLGLYRIVCLPEVTHTIARLTVENTISQEPMWAFNEFAHMIARMRSLSDIVLKGTVVGFRSWRSFTPVVFPHLSSVTLAMDEDEDQYRHFDEDMGNPYIADMLLLFCSSPVKTLRVLLGTSAAAKPISYAMRLTGLRFKRVTYLYWEVPLSNSRDSRTFINAFPSVEFVYMVPLLDEFLEILIDDVAPGGGPLWPRLHTFYWAFPQVQRARQFVQNRIDQGKPLRELRMWRGMNPPTRDDVEWLENNVKIQWVREE